MIIPDIRADFEVFSVELLCAYDKSRFMDEDKYTDKREKRILLFRSNSDKMKLMEVIL